MKRDHFEGIFAPTDGSLSVTAADLGDSGFTDAVLTPLMPSDRLEITDVSALPAGADQVRIAGRAALPGAGLTAPHPVEATFELVGVDSDGEGEFRARLVYDLAAQTDGETPWTFTESFPDLPHTLSGVETAPLTTAADLLNIQRPRFVATNVAHDAPDLGVAIQPGLNFVGEWRLGDAPIDLAAFAFATGDQDDVIQVHGPIVLEPPSSPEGGPERGIHLRATLGWQASLPGADNPLFTAALREFRFFSPLDRAEGTPTDLAYVGELALPALGRSVEVTLRRSLGSPFAFLDADFGADGTEGVSVADVGSLVGLDESFDRLPPDVVQRLEGLALQRIASTLVVRDGAPSVALFSLEIGLDDVDMELFDGVFALNELGLVASAIDPFGSRIIAATLRAKTTLLDVPWNLSLGLPDGLLSASLAEATTLDFENLFAKFGLPVLIDDLVIDRMEISGRPGRRYTVTTRVAESSPLSIDVGTTTIDLRDLALDLTRTSGPPGAAGTTGSLSGTLALGGVDLDMSAELPASADDGWLFTGRLDIEESLSIGVLLNGLLEDLGGVELPSAVADFAVVGGRTTFHTRTKDFTFDLTGTLPLSIEGADGLDARISLELLHQADGGTNKRLSGTVVIGDLEFGLIFSQDTDDGASTSTLAAVFHSDDGVDLVLRDLLDGRLPADVVDAIPASLSITLNDAFLAYQKSDAGDQSSSRFVLGLDMGTGIDLSALPLVGQSMPAGQRAQLGYRLLVASDVFSFGSAAAINALLPDGTAGLVDEQTEESGENAVDKGLGLAVDLQLGDLTVHLASPVDPPTDTSSANAVTTGGGALPVTPRDDGDEGVKWVDVKKSFGPAHFQRIGVRFRDGELAFLLDASMSAGGLTLSLDGLAVSSPLDRFDPRFDLRGIGIEYRGGPVRIGGTFLRIQRDGIDEFVGRATLQAKELTLTAVGAYTRIDGQTSLFVYAVLDYPIGGPSFFFITGLAAGFGYNREVIMPAIDQVADFPLVGVATGSLEPAPDPTTELRRLSDAIIPRPDRHFLAVGIKFNSFKLIDSFALLVISFGERFRLDLLGLSKLVLPTPLGKEKPVDPIAEVELALKASFVPDEGLLSVEARLTNNSYILSRKCTLTGGFAFFCWFSGPHGGDFVVSLGGYHPSFRVPAHYPTVPRLGFNWAVDSHLTVKGSAYMALTATAFMAGGALEASYHSGDLKAWFHAHADFLISWKPYHYEISMGVEIGASYTLRVFGTHELTITVGASLEIWGPDFAGHAEVDLVIITVPVDFGANGKAAANPIDWETFRDSFLPAPEEVVSISVQAGLLGTAPSVNATESETWIVNAKELSFVTNSAVPINTVADPFLGAPSIKAFDIGTMKVTRGQFESQHHIEIVDENDVSAEDLFKVEPITKSVPAALWGPKLSPGVNDARLVEDTLSGFRIVPAEPPKAGASQPLERSKLRYNIEPAEEDETRRFRWAPPVTFRAQDSSRDDVVAAYADPSAARLRADTLKVLGMDPGLIDVHEIPEFILLPRVQQPLGPVA